MKKVWGLVAVFLGAGLAVAEEKPRLYEVETIKGESYLSGDTADKVRHKLDLYLPKGEKNYPVLFFIHGGGWTRGSKDGFAKHGEMFAAHGVAFVSTNYRLSPAVTHPGHIEDVASAFAWAHKELGARGADLKRIFVSGHSAGGHLAALLGCDPTYLKKHDLSLADIRGVMPISGVFSISSRLSRLFGDEASRKQASPLTFAGANLPPLLLFYGDKEAGALGKQAEEYAKAVQEAKGAATVKMIKDRDHGSVVRKAADVDDEVAKLIFAFIAGNGSLPKEK
jgi:acetyl esterase/lipase